MVTLVLVKNPFSPQDGREIRHIEAGGSLADLLEENRIEGVDLQATVNGYSVDENTVIKDEDFVVIYPVIEKGGKGGKSILGIVAAIALSVVSFGIASGGWLAGLGKAFAAGAWGAYAAATAVMFLGSALIGRLSGQKTDLGGYESENSKATYSWAGVQTMEGQNNPIALTYGKVKSGGQTIAKFVDIDDNDECLNWLVACGEGELVITDIKLNDNDIDNFDDADFELRKGTNDQSVITNFNNTYFTKNVSYKLDNTWVTDMANGTDTRGLRFEIEFPNGLCHISDSGKVENATVNLDIEYRKITTDANDNVTYGAWTNLFKELASNSYGVTLAKNVAAGSYTMKIQCLWDDDEDGYRSWFYNVRISIGSYSGTIRKKDIGSKVVTVGAFRVDTDKWSDSLVSSVKNGNDKTATLTVSNGSGNGVITAARNSALRKQFTVNHIPGGEYEVRVKVSYRQYAETNTQASSTCYLTAITSIIYDDFTYPCTALLGISAVATDQLNGSPSLSFLKERTYVYVWNGSSYVKKRADNPAWASYDLLHQARRLKNINTGNWEYEVRGAPADRIRYSDFAAWANWCNEKDLTVNIEINTSGEVLEVINQRIAPIGRGMVVRFGTRYGCIYDHVQQPVQMFNMGNILAGSFSEEFLKVADRANCVEVTFTNADADYQRDVLTIYGSTFDSDGYAKTAQLTMDGITDYKQAYREGKYHLMCNRYQLRTVSFEAGIDAIACTVGDVILVSHDVPKWANSGRIESVDDLTMVLPVYISDTTKSYRIQFRTVKDNLYTIPCTIIETSSNGWTTIGLESDYSESDPPQAGDVFDLAIANIGSKPFVVKSITRAQDFTRRITCIEYAEALFEENYEIPPIQYATKAVGNAKNVTGLSAKQFQYTDENRVRHGMMSVSWKRASGGGRYTVLISTDKKKWTNATETSNTFAEFNVKAKTDYYVKVVTILGVSQSTGVTTGLISCGQDVPPKAVTGLSYKVDPADRTKAEVTWNENTDIDFRNYKVSVAGGKTYTTASNIITIVSNTANPTVTVFAVDNAGNQSAGASCQIPIYPYPSNVTGFAVTQQTTDRSVLEFTWDAVTDSDLSQYELRAGNSWAAGTQFARTKTRKTTYQVASGGTYKFWISAINNADVYSQTPTGLTKVVNLIPDAVTDLTVTQSTKDRSKAVIKFTRSPGKDIDHYSIRYGNTWVNGTEIVDIKDNRFEWQVPASGTYNVMVKAVTVAGFESAVTNTSITITIEPMDVTNFRAAQSTVNKTTVLLSWDAVNQTDVAYYIIKQGTSWNTASMVAPRVSGTTFEVLIEEEHQYSWMIKAVTIAGNESQYPAEVAAIFGLEPTPVSVIQLRQNPKDRSQLNIQWNAVPDGDLVGYQVKVGDNWDSAEEIPLTNELYATYTLTETESVHVMIRTLNSAGFYSDETSASLRCTVEPTNCTNFVAYQDGEMVELYWTVSTDIDVTGYEIREGSSFDTGALVATGVTNNFFTVPVDIERLYQYHIVAINKAGFKSSAARTSRVNVENLPPKNVIQTFDELARQSGTHSNTEFGESSINFQTVGGRFSDYTTTKFADLGGSQVLKLKLNTSTGKYPASGTYTLAKINVGSIITAKISVYFVSTVMYAGDVSAVLEFRTSLDNSIWMDWTEFKPVQRRFRYVQFRVKLATKNTNKTPEVNHLLISIDVPDTDIAITASIAAAGTTVPYGHTFYAVPNVTANAIGETVHARVISRTKTECVIKVFNTSNTAVAGTVDIKIKGY